MLNLVKIGETIKQLRTDNNITQEQLAERLFVSRQAVSRWEMGLALPSIDNICELTKIFGASFEKILCLDQQNKLNPNNLFENNSREYVINQFVIGQAGIDLAEVMYQFSNSERMLLLAKLKSLVEEEPEHPFVQSVNLRSLWVRLTDLEKQYFNLEQYKKEARSY